MTRASVRGHSPSLSISRSYPGLTLGAVLIALSGAPFAMARTDSLAPPTTLLLLTSMNSCLRAITGHWGRPLPTETAAVAVNQRVFGSSGQKSSTGDLVTSRFTMTAAADYPEGHFFKTIARPDRIVRFDSVHSVVLTSGTYVLSDGRPLPPRPGHPGFSSLITEGALRLHHYMLKSRQEFERKRQRWAGQDLSNRLTDGYFIDRDRSVNAMRDERLTVFAERIRELIGRARRGAR